MPPPAHAPGTAAAHRQLLGDEELGLLLHSCVDILPNLTLGQLLQVLEAVVAMGGCLPKHQSSPQGTHVQAGLASLCSRAMQLVVQLQPGMDGVAADSGDMQGPVPSLEFGSWDAQGESSSTSSGACGGQPGAPRGVAAQLLSHAADLCTRMPPEHGATVLLWPLPKASTVHAVVQAWQVLLQLGYFHATFSATAAGHDANSAVGRLLQQRRRQQQLCLAMYRAAEAHVTDAGLQDDRQVTELLSSLVSQMPHAPPSDWMDAVVSGIGQQVPPTVGKVIKSTREAVWH